MKIIYLTPLSGYATTLRSDTLWGMLCWGIRHLWGAAKLDQFLDACAAGNPPFVISSTFPYKYPYDIAAKRYRQERMPFFPNPLLSPDGHDDDPDEALKNARLRKPYKAKMAFVNHEDFASILQGALTAKDLRQRLRDIMDEEEALKQEAIRSAKPLKKRVPSQVEIDWAAPYLEDFSMTHNTIDRLRGGTLSLPVAGSDEPAGQLFHSPENYWTDPYADPHQGPNTGLFFLADGKDLSLLEPVLRLFRHWGFGADRSSGKGFFDVHIPDEDFNLPQPADANAMLNLSLFRPKPDELAELDQDSADEEKKKCFQYRIELRGGHAGHHGRELTKQVHRYFAEGSVFPLLSNLTGRHLGELQLQKFDEDLPPAHRVFDNGFGFMLPLKWL